MYTVLLAGGGHTHLEVIKSLSAERDPFIRWVLLSPDRYHYYSGMFSGYAEGLYSLDEIRVDLKQLCLDKKIDFMEVAVESIKPDQKKVVVSSGQILFYDRLSIDVGSHTAPDFIEGLQERQVHIKPAHLFPERMEVCQLARELVIIGGGAAACEMAFSFHAWKEKRGRKYDVITVISSGPFINEQADPVIESLFRQKGIQFYKNDRAIKVDDRYVYTENDRDIPYHEVMFLGGAQAPKWLEKSGLSTDEKGFVLVDATLQTVDHSDVFAAGDCAALATHPHLPKSGVYAVRQGKVLAHNLVASLKREKLNDYIPQKRGLILLATGNKEALALYGKVVRFGKLAWLWKDWIDVRYMRKLKKLSD
ncbi:NAD(P)/FAD-dependent oxidoreductase [Jeotgalibacillus aurantiacus]|uniref:NAD(P)/FAD-dependent oxidoreductase n=1 Tax=Jeotgalibacillus aurantiacus TaxID=2763266 RepID=UPI001D09F040|nr:FAD-dependent oxidoreductase [Jeotgalibacillus aurantiacus]